VPNLQKRSLKRHCGVAVTDSQHLGALLAEYYLEFSRTRTVRSEGGMRC
jgi:hypothetical protein